MSISLSLYMYTYIYIYTHIHMASDEHFLTSAAAGLREAARIGQLGSATNGGLFALCNTIIHISFSFIIHIKVFIVCLL